MNIRLFSCLILIDVILIPQAISAESLQCSCDCGVENNGGDITTTTTLSSFISQVRGEKGDRGFNGKRGARGQRGSVGDQGPLGLQGITGSPGLPAPGSSGSGSVHVMMSSCSDLRRAGYTENGIYKIQTTNTSSINQVYCDMEVDGGGWTLIASVHENDIDGKCSTGDNWSDNSNGKSTNTNSWSNTRVFGSVDGATGSDYKNSQYYSLPASDVMIWHLPNNLPTSQWTQQATFKYYTNNSFLTQYGGNLHDLYSNHYPMELQSKITEGIQSEGIVNFLSESSADILNKVPGFYKYEYDAERNSLRDAQVSIKVGSGGVFHPSRGGNRVYVRAGDEDWHLMVYGDTFTDHHAYDLTNMATSHPFTTLMYIENNQGIEETFDLKVESLIDGMTGSHSKSIYAGNWRDGEGEFSVGDFTVKFMKYDLVWAYKQDCVKHQYSHVYCRGDRTYHPTVCEVYFVIYSSKEWNSVVANETSFFHSTKWGKGRDLKNTVRVDGNPQNILLGYTLFSKGGGDKTEMPDIENALKVMVNKITQFNPKEELEDIRNSLNETGKDITDELPKFNFYNYDGILEPVKWGGEVRAIKTGGKNMFQGDSNRVFTRSSSTDWHELIYGRTFTEENKYEISSSIYSHPFIAIMNIQNSDGSDEAFHIKVESKINTRWEGTSSKSQGKIKFGDFTLEYKTYNIYENFDRSTINEIYFVVYNFKTWYSVISENAFGPDWSTSTSPWVTNIDGLNNNIYVNGHPRNILMGYTLFSRENGNPMRHEYVKDAMMIILKKIALFSTKNEMDCSRLDESVVAPIHFHTGNIEDITSSIPPTQKLGTTPGYLQLRAVSPQGLPYAMCPAVKTESCRPSSLCIGGISTLKVDPSSCGDFSGYGGIEEDKPTETEADGSARSLNDLKSSILIFTRDSTATSSKVY